MAVTLADELDRAAAQAPTHVFLRTLDDAVAYEDCRRRVAHAVAQLDQLGVERGDTVALLMGNSIDQVVLWFALSRLGAVHAPLNTALRGQALTATLVTTRASVVIADPDLLDVLDAAAAAVADPPLLVTVAGLPQGTGASATHPAVDELETATLLMTSGTSGASKACALSHRYLLRQGQLHASYLGLGPDDVLFCPFPLFHIDAATLTVVAALSVRGTAALSPRFSASRFWEEVRSFDATVFNFMGATLTILWKQPRSGSDRDHRVRLAWGVPMPEWQRSFEERFGIPLRQVYGLTDAGVPVYDPLDGDLQRPGRAGRVIAEYDLRVDPDQRRLGDADGVGEILVRGREPGLVMNGYFGNPTATAETIVDGWVRTGDLGAVDADGYLAFHGRLSDSIRRRGENISATEVEELVTAHPGVREASAVGVPSELTEEDVLVWVVPQAGSTVTPEEIRDFCLANGPAFMAPRFLRMMLELPKTPTEKVEKYKIRNAALTADVWDGERRRHATE